MPVSESQRRPTNSTWTLGLAFLNCSTSPLVASTSAAGRTKRMLTGSGVGVGAAQAVSSIIETIPTHTRRRSACFWAVASSKNVWFERIIVTSSCGFDVSPQQVGVQPAHPLEMMGQVGAQPGRLVAVVQASC